MSDGRGMPLLSGQPPEYTANEASCRKCNKEFTILFTRSRKCNHCGYLYCHSCTDYQALMPRRQDADAGNTVGYDPMPVCGICIEMLQITASGKGQLKQLPMAKLKKYAKAYNIDVSGILEKDEFVAKLVAARTPEGCLPHVNESYYRKYSIPKRASNRSRSLFSRAMDAMSGDRNPTSATPPPRQQPQPQPQFQQRQQYPQYPRPRTNSGPSTYNPHHQTDPRMRQQHPHSHQPQPSNTHPHSHYSPPPGPPPRHSHSARPDHVNVPPQRPRAASTSSHPRATSPARPVVVPSVDQLLEMSDEQVAALSIGSLKEILFKNHVTARLVVEKGELVSRVKTLIEQEKAERDRKAAEEAAEREYEEQMRRAREQSQVPASVPQPAAVPTSASPDVKHDEQMPVPQRAGTGDVQMPDPQPAEGAATSIPPTSGVTPPPASTLTPQAQVMASRLERTGLCVICQDEEANIAIVDCGHLAMCRGCSDLIMSSTRECPLCRTRIVTESRLLRIFRA